MSAHYFVSDAHIGGSLAGADERLYRFLHSLRGRADSLYIVGDLFEFWFEYNRAIPKHGFHVLAQLEELSEEGTRLTYLRGNHDFWFKDFLKRELKAETADELDVTIDGKRVYVSHGDALDRGFVPKLFRGLVRSQLNGMLYSLLHPDIGIALAQRVALASRDVGARAYLSDDMARFAEKKLGQGFDIVIMGHSHAPETRLFNKGVYINIGDWLRHFTYGVIRDGIPALEQFDG